MADRPDLDLSAAPPTRDSVEELLAAAVAAPAPAAHALAPGTVVRERYAIERALGAGGMGTVYLARDLELARAVALKVHRDAADDRLRREAVAMARLAHPNVVTVFEIGELDGRAFVAMEYIPGHTLRAHLAARRRRRAEILELLCAAGEGLVAAHAAGLVHRDVKPDNILVGEDGRVRIGDFGLARETGEAPVRGDDPALDASTSGAGETGGRLTAIGAVIGTPAYMAPEQLDGGELDARTDQFAFCVVAWEALCGQRPFTGEALDALRAAIARGPVPTARSGGARGRPEGAAPAGTLPARLRRVLARGLAEDPAARWPSMRALLAALRAAERRPRLVAAGAGGLLVAGAALAWAAWPAADPAAACAGAGAEIDALIPPELVAAAAAAARGDGRPTGADEAARVEREAVRYRASYRAAARTACEARARGQWAPELAAASAECVAYQARTARELFVAAPDTATHPADVLPMVIRVPRVERCVDPRVLAAWRPIASSAAELDAIVAARARLDAARQLLELNQVAAAERTHEAVAAGPGHADPAIARRLALLRGSIAVARNAPATAEPILTDAYFQARAHDDGALVLAAARDLIDLAGRVRRDRDATDRWIRDALAEVERHHALAPEGAIDVLVSAASALEVGGDPARALGLIERATALGAEGTATLAVRANIHANRGDVAAALADLETLVAALRDQLGADHPRVAAVLGQRAAIALAAGDRAAAKQAADDAVAILARAGDDRSSTAAMAALNLGATLLELGAHEAAAEHLERAREIWLASHGERHPDVALADTNLAIVYLRRKDVPRALALLRAATATQEALLGPDHEELAAALFNLAVAERNAGQLDAALATATRCLDIMRARQPTSLLTAQAYGSVAYIQSLRRAYPAALAAAEAALAIPATDESPLAAAWVRLETARALIGLRRDPARARRLLGEARAHYAAASYTDRVTEIDALLAGLR